MWVVNSLHTFVVEISLKYIDFYIHDSWLKRIKISNHKKNSSGYLNTKLKIMMLHR